MWIVTSVKHSIVTFNYTERYVVQNWTVFYSFLWRFALGFPYNYKCKASAKKQLLGKLSSSMDGCTLPLRLNGIKIATAFQYKTATGDIRKSHQPFRNISRHVLFFIPAFCHVRMSLALTFRDKNTAAFGYPRTILISQ